MSFEIIKGLEDFENDIHEKLVNNGYTNIKAISISTPENIVIDTGLSYRLAEDIISKSISLVVNPPLSAKEMLKLEQNKGKVTTSSNGLDTLLAGGPWSGEITEISGAFATGKSQLCFQLCVNAQLKREQGGLDGKVFFVDTEGTFSATRIGEIAIDAGLDPEKILENIYVARVLDSHNQTRIIQKINEIAQEENIKLVIVDSIAAHFRSDYIGNDKIAERQQRIMQHASSLTNLAYVHDIAVVVTNQMVAKVDDLSGMASKSPALGESWSHRPQTRLVLRKSPGSARVARLTDSPRRPESEEIFYITDGGIKDRPKG